MRDYTEDNIAVVKVGMRRHLQHVGKPMLIDMLKQVAQHMVETVDRVFTPMPPYESRAGGNDVFPVWRGHMHDATGVAIYDEGTLLSYLPTKKAIKTQYHEGAKIEGMEELKEAINAGASKFSKGLWIVLYSAVPYGMEVNNEGSKWWRGQGYFDTLSEDFFRDILMGLNVIDL